MQILQGRPVLAGSTIFGIITGIGTSGPDQGHIGSEVHIYLN
jgi:hypothetical protein